MSNQKVRFWQRKLKQLEEKDLPKAIQQMATSEELVGGRMLNLKVPVGKLKLLNYPLRT